MARNLAATFVVLFGFLAGAFAADTSRRTYANPVDVDYRYNFEQANEQISYRTGADPVIVRHKDAYYLFMTLADGYWRSTNLLDWTFITPSRWPFASVVAPAAISDGDRLLLMPATTGPDPANPDKSIDQPYNASLSGASNLGPTSRKLLDAVAARALAYRAENGLATGTAVPVDAVTASASGLDPDISLANARLQLVRVARTRGLSEQQLQALVERETTPRQLGLLGEPRVNVLQLNLALDAAVVHRAAAP